MIKTFLSARTASRPGANRADRPLPRRDHPSVLVAAALTALLLGFVIYVTDRSGSDRHLFGAAGHWLPTLIHPFAFSLLTATVLPARSAARYGACVAWGAVNVLFEAGQHVALSVPLAGALYEVFGRMPPVRWIADYFLLGTFDLDDLLAACLGALAAAAVIHLVRPGREPTPCVMNETA